MKYTNDSRFLLFIFPFALFTLSLITSIVFLLIDFTTEFLFLFIISSIAIFFFGKLIINDLIETETLHKGQIAVKFQGKDGYSFLHYKPSYNVKNADEIITLVTFEEAKEEKIELTTKTRDGKEYSMGVAIIKYHIKERTDYEINTFLNRYIRMKNDCNATNIIKEFKANVEERIRAISLQEVERDFEKIIREEKTKLEKKTSYFVKIHAYYF